jgi:N-acetylglucosaminyl-diphospho-decaprenol L-rhamnosyltransferase
MAAEVAIAVVSWNTRDLLDRCLRSLEPESSAGRADVWVVDNASADGSAELVRERFPRVNLIASDENIGFGRAVNRVAERTRTPWIAAANADVELEAGALAVLLAAGERLPEAGALAPRLVLPDGSTQHSVHPFPTIPFTLAFNVGLPAVSRGLGDRLCLEGAWDPDRERDVPWAIGAFLLLRREAWNDVGGFSEAQWMYAEDLDLGWRLAKAGWTTRYEPGAVVHHHESAASKVAFGGQAGVVDKWVRANNAWMVRRQGLARTWAANGIAATEAGLRVLALSALARGNRDRFGEKLDWARRDLKGARSGLRSKSKLLEAR